MLRCLMDCHIKSALFAGKTICMGIQLQWEQHDPDILLFDLRSNQTWDDFHAAVQQGIEMLYDVPYPVYVITLSASGFPPSASILSHFHKVAQQLPPNMALIVVVTDNFLVETINQIFFKISPLGRKLGRLAKTMDEARQIIAQYHAQWGTISQKQARHP